MYWAVLLALATDLIPVGWPIPLTERVFLFAATAWLQISFEHGYKILVSPTERISFFICYVLKPRRELQSILGTSDALLTPFPEAALEIGFLLVILLEDLVHLVLGHLLVASVCILLDIYRPPMLQSKGIDRK